MSESPRKRLRSANPTSLSEKAKKYYVSLGEQEDGKKLHQCTECSAIINGTKAHNLAIHLQNVHHKIYGIITGKNENVKTERLKLLQNVVEILTVNGRPFTYILDSGFKSIVQDKLDYLRKAGCGLNLSDNHLPEVKEHLSETANRVRQKIRDEVRGRALALLVDIGTKNRRSIFSISLQYCVNGKVRVRSIGMIELLSSHTAVYLAEIISAQLKIYEIDLRQILTITTDNGSNVLKMVRDVDELLQNATEKPQAAQEPPNTPTKSNIHQSHTDIQTDNEIEKLLAEMHDVTDDEALEELFDDAFFERNENLLSAMSDKMTTDFGLDVLWDITGVNCAAHTLQLGIKDALKAVARKHSNLISLCRSVAKALRLKSMRNTYKEHGGVYKIPRLDVETRWGSTYLMVRFEIYFYLLSQNVSINK